MLHSGAAGNASADVVAAQLAVVNAAYSDTARADDGRPPEAAQTPGFRLARGRHASPRGFKPAATAPPRQPRHRSASGTPAAARERSVFQHSAVASCSRGASASARRLSARTRARRHAAKYPFQRRGCLDAGASAQRVQHQKGELLRKRVSLSRDRERQRQTQARSSLPR